ncbi:hypothetical protein JL09_g6158 [Pichia kudriavzevii]|uniref:Uncharacterized protein n=1 Tax=Pichia kudriavzevii TaxID=4909 RepID=A0A099NPF6_PICKU|nr:hypothetical protein JL09_g6158 [Pichia kudriavzevii]
MESEEWGFIGGYQQIEYSSLSVDMYSFGQ